MQTFSTLFFTQGQLGELFFELLVNMACCWEIFLHPLPASFPGSSTHILHGLYLLPQSHYAPRVVFQVHLPISRQVRKLIASIKAHIASKKEVHFLAADTRSLCSAKLMNIQLCRKSKINKENKNSIKKKSDRNRKQVKQHYYFLFFPTFKSLKFRIRWNGISHLQKLIFSIRQII